MTRDVSLGLKENWKQFSLLVLVNAFVGGMVGLERTILPKLAEEKFGLETHTVIFSFIIVFGVAKAITNYFTGILADKHGRKKLLIMGWLFALPIPFILIYASNWSWVVFANVLLGINQGLAWSSTVVMKIDLVGPRHRGLAMGLNESAGYLAVGGIAFLTGWVAANYGLLPYPFYIGVIIALAGLFFSVFFVKDTVHHVVAETEASSQQELKNVFVDTTWKDPNLGSITQAGLVNNLNDGMIWGLFPMLLASLGFGLEAIGILAAIYPGVWGIGQLFTGRLADILPKKQLLFWGMFAQAIALIFMAYSSQFFEFAIWSILLGLGTALVYPTFLAGIADHAHPAQRANSIGVFRLWRDLGYAIGAFLTGLIGDAFGLDYALMSIALLTLLSSLVIRIRMR